MSSKISRVQKIPGGTVSPRGLSSLGVSAITTVIYNVTKEINEVRRPEGPGISEACGPN